ncbi:copper homeostasis protein [Arthrobacter alpinus]|uniref:PF03932 family protein CutC n=1 Tax=Arthrobacter alpinus TaxID=656366 RepID=A0A1H5I8C5_9MICC|nr:copper homeostasis protein CutC [Arthrobacter alpinus]SEE36379.1 copper homeostasis protein [Arthrobacter alpinus]
MKLEIAVVSAQGAAIAAEEGADRIELCTSLELGGLTPSLGLLEISAECVADRLEIHPLVRCRPGDFVYSTLEVETMIRDATDLLKRGVNGVVFGALLPSGGIDCQASRRFVESALAVNPDAQLTFHRAIDSSTSGVVAVEKLISLGFTRVLSSGGAPTAGDGLFALAAMNDRAAGRIEIMAGGGLRVADIASMGRAGLSAVHLSAKEMVNDGGPDTYMVTNREVVRKAREAANAFSTCATAAL